MDFGLLILIGWLMLYGIVLLVAAMLRHTGVIGSRWYCRSAKGSMIIGFSMLLCGALLALEFLGPVRLLGNWFFPLSCVAISVGWYGMTLESKARRESGV